MESRIYARVLLALIAGSAATVMAQDYPQRPIRMIVPFPPGGVTDVLARILGAKLGERLGQQVVIDNRAGASGIIGTDMVAKSQPDGHTLLMSASSHATFSSLYSKVPFDAVRDFAPITLTATVPYVMVVHPTLPVKSVKELIDYAKKSPGKLSYAGSAPGLAQHLGWELFKRMTGTDMVYVPYKGSAAQMPDLLAGRLQAALDSVSIMMPHLKTGALHGLAVAGAKRSALLPDLPTIAEAGVPGFQVSGWFGLFSAAKTPARVVNKLNQEVGLIMQQPDVRERLSVLAIEPVGGPPDDLRKWVARETEVWGKVIRDAGVKVE
jgi:tripartite-type tricarboxylate transporter receptor subunit TctC